MKSQASGAYIFKPRNPEVNTKFLASYYHNDSWWGISFYAQDWADAEAICQKLSLRLDGEHVATLPYVGGSWFPDLICWLKNWKLKES